MSGGDTIFREYRISDAERSDRSAGDRLRHRQKVRDFLCHSERSLRSEGTRTLWPMIFVSF